MLDAPPNQGLWRKRGVGTGSRMGKTSIATKAARGRGSGRNFFQRSRCPEGALDAGTGCGRLRRRLTVRIGRAHSHALWLCARLGLKQNA